MRLTDPRQLDALPIGSRVAPVASASWESLRVRTKAGAGWRASHYGRPIPAEALMGVGEGLYLVDATATSAEDLNRLLPGAVVVDCEGGVVYQRLTGGLWSMQHAECEVTASVALQYAPLTILHPGTPEEDGDA